MKNFRLKDKVERELNKMVTLVGTEKEIIALLNDDVLVNCPKDKNVISECPADRHTCYDCMAKYLKVQLFYTDKDMVVDWKYLYDIINHIY